MEILPQLIVNSLITGSVYALASSGLSLAYGLLKILNFAHGHIMMVGAYIFYAVFILAGFSLPVSGAVAFAASIALGWITMKVFVAPFTKTNLFLVFVTTLAFSTMLESIVSMVFGVNVKSLTKGGYVQSLEFAGIYITPTQIVIIISSCILLSLLAFIIHYTSSGRLVRALSYHREAGESLGINSEKAITWAFIGGIVLACYAGILIGFETNIQPTMGSSYTIKAFAAMILGGLGNIWGTVLGSYILGFVENISIGVDLGSYSIPAGYKDAFAFAIILMVLLFKPSGLFGKKERMA